MQVPPVYVTYRQAHLPVGLGNKYTIEYQIVVFLSNQAETQPPGRCFGVCQPLTLKAKLDAFYSAFINVPSMFPP